MTGARGERPARRARCQRPARRARGEQPARRARGEQPARRARQVVFALGSNLGDRLATMQAGVDDLAAAPGIALQAVSAVFETSPVGGPDQPDYLNAVLLAVSALPGPSILDCTQAAERAQGRIRTIRWGPRTLDIDIIAIEGEISDDPRLTLPHPHAHERAFVLLPWHDVDPGAVLPGFGTVAGLIAGPGSDPGASGGAGTVWRRDDLRLAVRPQATANQGG